MLDNSQLTVKKSLHNISDDDQENSNNADEALEETKDYAKGSQIFENRKQEVNEVEYHQNEEESDQKSIQRPQANF